MDHFPLMSGTMKNATGRGLKMTGVTMDGEFVGHAEAD